MTGSVPRTMTVFCDETGAHDCAYFAWGSIWMAHERLNEFNAAIDAIAKKHGVKGEFGWKDTSTRTKFCVEVVRWFFQQRWVCFQSLFVRKQDMRIFSSERDHGDSVAYKKLLCTLMALQTVKFDALPGGPREFRIIVDRVGDKPSVAEEEYRILEATIRKWSDTSLAPVAKFARVDSQSARGIQLADLLVGAIRAEWEGGDSKAVKRGEFRRMLAECLGWENLRSTTPMNLKFNIWLHKACQGFAMRPMALKYPQGDPEAALGGRFGFGGGFRRSFGGGFGGSGKRLPVEDGGNDKLTRSREGAKGKAKVGVRESGERVEVRGDNGLTLTIRRSVGAVEAEKVLAKVAVAKVLTKKEMKAERARAKAERLKGKKERVRAWAKRKAKSRAKKKAKKEQWEARVKEKEASRKIAKPQKKVKEKTK